MDAGYRMIDTAAIYSNEGAVGKGIRECGVDGDELFATTKLWVQDTSYEHAMANILTVYFSMKGQTLGSFMRIVEQEKATLP